MSLCVYQRAGDLFHSQDSQVWGCARVCALHLVFTGFLLIVGRAVQSRDECCFSQFDQHMAAACQRLLVLVQQTCRG